MEPEGPHQREVDPAFLYAALRVAPNDARLGR